ncbi:isoprenyl transferase [Bacteroides sp. 214]|uniref:isoprenyl transferase n=1 Tax=Bacteroides sp. 214 TaxID=2302935 RepID=UPI0013D454D1|nr:isoprenyl transferase [Bacteroides sp. 214]NDW12592.1 isoprenyl transferase [Bacteroides sp. 214]
MLNEINIDPALIPQHIAIIMDGNGRWAKQHGKERSYGHQVGAQTARKIIEESARIGIKHLTLYTFSTENWNRPAEEISALMNLLLDSIEEDVFLRNNVSFRVIGDMSKMPADVQERLQSCINNVAHCTGMCLVLALSYSSRWEIAEAAKQIALDVQVGKITANEVDSVAFSSYLSTNFMPDPDLLIRTGGEVRLSNYLLWQCAYSELYFCDTYWPEFDEKELHRAIYGYQRRERRFGKTSEQI